MFSIVSKYRKSAFAALCAPAAALIISGCARTNLAEREEKAARPLTEVEQSCRSRPAAVTKKFRIELDTLTVIKSDEPRGVDPYLVAIGFQSTFGRPGSTRVEVVRRDLKRFASGQKAGARLDIPENAQPARAGTVVPMLFGDASEGCLRGTLFGTLLIGLERDASNRVTMRELLEPLQRTLEAELQRIVESSSPAELFAGGSIDAKLAQAETALKESVKLKRWEEIIVGAAALGNPDDPVGDHIIIGLATDKALLSGFQRRGALPNPNGGRTELIVPASTTASTIFLTSCDDPSAPCGMIIRETGQRLPKQKRDRTIRLSSGKTPSVIYDVNFKVRSLP